MTESLPPDVFHAWLMRAKSDLNLGWVALETKGVLLEDACFHAQQCSEKALKALLMSQQIDFPRTHIIELLLDLLKAQGVLIPESVDHAYVLTQYAVQTRYPGDWEPVTLEEAKQALDQARIVIDWVETELRLS